MESSYTGPERRWMTRSLYTWADRQEQFYNQRALEYGRTADTLYKLRNRMTTRVNRDALFNGYWLAKCQCDKFRVEIATEVEPWFSAEAFG